MASLYLVFVALFINASSALPQIVSSVVTAPATTSVTLVPPTGVSSTSTFLSSDAVPSQTIPVTVTGSISASSGVIHATTSEVTIPITTVVPSSTPVPTPTPSFTFKIHPNGNTAKCLDVRGGLFANETPVQIFDCNGSAAQNWNISPGRTKVVLAGTGFCLDAGSTPGNGVGMKIFQCFDNLAAQDWFYTADQRIALTNQGQCLDLTNGVLTNSNQVQTFQCTDFNTNQIWTLST